MIPRQFSKRIWVNCNSFLTHNLFKTHISVIMIKDSLLNELFAVISNDAIRAASRNALKRPRSNRSMKLVRCFKGGYNAQQETPIMIALEEFTAKGLIIVETLSEKSSND